MAEAKGGGMSVQKHPHGYTTGCYVVGIALVAYVFLALLIILITHLDLVPGLVTRDLLRTHVLCAGFGMLGASTASIRRYYRVLITESTARISGRVEAPSDWTLGWIYYYLTRPVLGAILGALSFTLSYVGFHVLSSVRTDQVSVEGKNLLFAVAFVSGFSVSHVLDRLEAVSKQLFQKGRGPDKTEE